MKNFTYYTILIFSSFLFFSGYIFNFKNTTKIKIKQDKEIKKDTSSNKLPEGYPYIINFSPLKQKHTKSICFDNYGIMVFADNSGVSFFDGETEQNIEIPQSPNQIKKDKKENIFYIACKTGYGILSKNKYGNYSYTSISDIYHDKNPYDKLIVTKNKVYFINSHKIVEYDIKTQKINELFSERNKYIYGTFFLNNELFVSLKNEGIFTLEKNTLNPVSNDTLFAENEILMNVPLQNDKIILGFENNELCVFDGKNYSPYKTDSKEYIKESIINDGGTFNEKLFIITTLNGGAIIINKETGKTKYTLNYRTGLPDDEIFAFSSDKTGGLWLSHEYGVSRAALDIPVKSFNDFPGLQGNINAVKFFDSTLYVATSEGLFKLFEIKNYEEVKIAENKKVKYTKKIKISNNKKYTLPQKDKISSDIIDDNEETDDYKEESNIFKRWKIKRNKKRKKKEEETASEPQNNLEEENIPAAEKSNIEKETKKNKRKSKYLYKTEYKTITEYKKIYELHSVKFVYKKIEGINSKCKSLTEYEGGLLAGTNSGLYFVENTESKPVTVIPDIYTYDISSKNNGNTFYVSSSKGIYKVSYKNKKFNVSGLNAKTNNNTLKSIYMISDSLFWASGIQKVYKFKTSGSHIISTEIFNLNSGIDEDIIISKNKEKIVFITNTKAWYFNEKNGNLAEDVNLSNKLENAEKIYLLTDSTFSVNLNSKTLYFGNSPDSLQHLKYTRIFDNIKRINTDKANNIWLITEDNNIFQIKPENLNKNTKFNIFIADISNFNGNSFGNKNTLELGSNYKSITVKLTSPGYLKKGFIKYFYGIDINSKNEFLETDKSLITIPELTPGKHIISIYALNALNEKSNILEISVEVKPPFWQTTWFVISIFTLFLIAISVSISAFYRNKQRKIKEYNEILELKVKERTAEIQKQNKLIQKQNAEIFSQYQKIEIQNKEITDSIKYAGRIQKAALSDTGFASKYVSGFFIYFKPRDIVSGDFYWLSEINNKLMIAAVDCTGHGVPGGFLSMLGISFLNEIVKDATKTSGKITAATVLNLLRTRIIKTLSSYGEEERKDGMDMSLVIIDRENMQLNFAGANNPAYIIRDNKITKVDADRMPVGYNKKLNDIPFKNKLIQIKKDDIIYLFSDGYADQFGGKNQKKFNSRRFREMLLHIHKLPMHEQKIIADKILMKWKGENGQIDDILLIGIKI